jgi:hypothetical protein
MSSPQLTLYLAESGLNWLKLVVLMEEVRDLPLSVPLITADFDAAWSLLQVRPSGID